MWAERRRRFARSAQQRDVVVAQEAIDREQDFGPALAQQIRGLGPLVPRVDRHQDAADRVDRERHRDPLPEIGSPDRHAIASRDAERDQTFGGGAHPAVELCVAQVHFSVFDRRKLFEARHRKREHARNRPELEVSPGIRVAFHGRKRA